MNSRRLKTIMGMVGTTALLSTWRGDYLLQVPVLITDVKLAYGSERYKVAPIGGKGEAWVEGLNLDPLN